MTVDDTFIDGSCNTNPPVITKEGGMAIKCTGKPALVSKLQQKISSRSGYEIFAVLGPTKNPSKRGSLRRFNLEISMESDGIVVRFPRLCAERNTKDRDCKIFNDWQEGMITLIIRKDSDQKSIILRKQFDLFNLNNIF